MMDAYAAAKGPFERLSKGAYLDVLLPRSPDFDAAHLIKDGKPEELARAPARRTLFFGMAVNICESAQRN
jgi:hypothetical protein